MRDKNLTLWEEFITDLELVDEDFKKRRVVIFIIDSLYQLLSAQSKCHPAAKTVFRDEGRAMDIGWMGELPSSPFSSEVNGKVTLHEWFSTSWHWQQNQQMKCVKCGLRWSYHDKNHDKKQEAS